MQPSTVIDNVKCVPTACRAQRQQETVESETCTLIPKGRIGLLRPLVLVAPFRRCRLVFRCVASNLCVHDHVFGEPQVQSKYVTRQCAFTLDRIRGGRKMRSRLRALARDMASITYQGSRLLGIHLFDVCSANINDAYYYLTSLPLYAFVRAMFRGICHNWAAPVHQDGTPFIHLHNLVAPAIHRWREGGDFVPVVLPADASNILSDEVNHWVDVNISVYSSVRTVLQQCEAVIGWEYNRYADGEKECYNHACQLAKVRAAWQPHGHCHCNMNTVVPWLINELSVCFPPQLDDYTVAGKLTPVVCVSQCLVASGCYSLLLL
jgi:hypothetical protein